MDTEGKANVVERSETVVSFLLSILLVILLNTIYIPIHIPMNNIMNMIDSSITILNILIRVTSSFFLSYIIRILLF